MEAKIEKISELYKLLNVKTRMSDDLFHLFGKFGIGHLCIERILRVLGETFGMTPQHLMATICSNNKAMSKILVMAAALEKGDEVYGHTA